MVNWITIFTQVRKLFHQTKCDNIFTIGTQNRFYMFIFKLTRSKRSICILYNFIMKIFKNRKNSKHCNL